LADLRLNQMRERRVASPRLVLILAAALLPHRPVSRLYGPRIGGRATAPVDEIGKLVTNRPQGIWGRSQCDFHVLVIIGGNPVGHPDRRRNGAGHSFGCRASPRQARPRTSSPRWRRPAVRKRIESVSCQMFLSGGSQEEYIRSGVIPWNANFSKSISRRHLRSGDP
jgi:hypothetical protein